MKMLVIAALALLALGAQAQNFEALCRAELKDLRGTVVDEIEQLVSLSSSGRRGRETVYAGKFASPQDNLTVHVSLNKGAATFNPDIQIRRENGRTRSYTQQLQSRTRSALGYRAPGYTTFGPAYTLHFPNADLRGFKFFQENNLHDGEFQGSEGPTCYPTCPPPGPYEGPVLATLPRVGQLNVFCEIL